MKIGLMPFSSASVDSYAKQPASPLPWQHDSVSVFVVESKTGARIAETGPRRKSANGGNILDAAYIVHAANAYPKLVEALRIAAIEAMNASVRKNCTNLLRELGEAE